MADKEVIQEQAGMRVKTISVTYGRKWNLDDYESAHVEASLWADLDEDEDPSESMAELFNLAKAQVKAESMPMLQPRNVKRQELARQANQALKSMNGG